MNTAFDALEAAHELRLAGLDENQAEAIAKVRRSAAGADLGQLATKSDLRTEISQAVNRMLLAQVAVAGLLFAALKLWG